MSSQEDVPSTQAAKTIKAITKDTVHKICSGQVVLSLAIAVKELVENALDAGATTVEVKVREYGLESVEVSDNGSGVEESNFNGLTAKYHTSKLREFTDLETVATFGFRGEALSSLCALSDMKIVTKHHSVDVATKLELNHRGEIKKQTPCARQTGTTVTLANLFSTLPVRKREFQRNIQKEFAKMCQILQGYCLISYGKRIILTNHTAKGGKSTILSTNGSHSLLENIVAVFGAKQKTNLLEIQKPIEDDEVLTQDILKSLDSSINVTDADLSKLGLDQFRFDGFISSCSHGCGRSARDRQFYFINGRPCDLKTMAKLVNDVYHRYNQNQNPFVVLNVYLERQEVDVNITPDKRQVFVNNETILRLALKKSLLNTFNPVTPSFKMENQTLPNLMASRKQIKIEKEPKETMEDSLNVSAVSDDTEQDYTEKGNASKFANKLMQWRLTGNTDDTYTQKPAKRKQQFDEVQARTYKMKKIHEYLSQENPQSEEKCVSYKSESDTDSEEKDAQDVQSHNVADVVENTVEADANIDSIETETVENTESHEDELNESTSSNQGYQISCKVKAIDTPNRSVRMATYTPVKSLLETFTPKKRSTNQIVECNNVNVDKVHGNEASEVISDHHEVNDEEFDDESDSPAPVSQPENIMTLTTSISEIQSLMEEEINLKNIAENQPHRMKFKMKIDPKQNQMAEQELKTEIAKEDFIRMDLIGQFNLGFIIVRLDEDLFIIDQHATDEKYNFETLQKTTVLQHQPLVVPQDLDMTAVNEIILIDNLKVFEANGFRFEIDTDRPVTKRVKLIAKPFSRNWEFGKEDIDELLFMMQEGHCDSSYLDTCRPSRVRAMFASRACRSSVMIGTSLSKTDMRRLVDHMGTIEQPWNCPHGRPTIRHLLNLEMLNINDNND